MTRGRDPLRDLLVLQDRMNQVFADATQQRARTKAEADSEIEPADWFPAADVYESDDNYLVAIDLPGIERSALDISLENNLMAVRGERVVDEHGKQRLERPEGRFLRRSDVPATVDQEAIAANYEDVVLSHSAAKASRAKGATGGNKGFVK